MQLTSGWWFFSRNIKVPNESTLRQNFQQIQGGEGRRNSSAVSPSPGGPPVQRPRQANAQEAGDILRHNRGAARPVHPSPRLDQNRQEGPPKMGRLIRKFSYMHRLMQSSCGFVSICDRCKDTEHYNYNCSADLLTWREGANPYVCLSNCLPVSQSVRLPIQPSAHSPNHPYVHPSVLHESDSSSDL